jgi:hypothetical protein
LYVNTIIYDRFCEAIGDMEDSGILYQNWASAAQLFRMDKQTHYRWLVDKTRNSYQNDTDHPGLVWCDICEEINLWTYWQGRGCLNADILLVGQDWGCLTAPLNAPAIENVRRINQNQPAFYMDGNPSQTDRNLVVLFEKSLGMNLLQNNSNLFFTNLLLGYRTDKNSGGLQNSLMAHDVPRLKELVHILRPKIMICLGKITYTHVLNAYGVPTPPNGSYNALLNAGQNYIDLPDMRVYGMAHCGVLGCMNRGNHHGVDEGLALQIQDWQKIR